MTDRMLIAVTRVSRIRFSQATADAQTRTERATAFLAVLVLVRRGMLKADQPGLFAEIDLSQGDTHDQDMLQDMENEFVN
jgi:chromatin segregation and condensation protein Rec8/ScpA/Scc1 (kleisin family)